ncbi:uncharacterized protein LOC115058789 [Echeneis naucrates]|uniref:Uncharacterized LOC115058789 n=1 Tax=Echeneis naucrates TaxID=173247 RepID=A0A665VIE9_ECHNA|nr:uncharacterized protein LOC115058789 [Echeneis naucrates]
MEPLKHAMYLTYLFLWSSAPTMSEQSSEHISQEKSLYAATAGENVTLRCFYKDDAVMFYWYKQTWGQKPRLMSTFYKHKEDGIFHNEFKDNPRFKLNTGNGKNHLTILDLRFSDSATYYCIGCCATEFEFIEGLSVSVQGSGLTILASVYQSGTDTIGPSHSLSCTVHSGSCEGEQRAHWFKQSEESHPGLFYIPHECTRKPDTQTNTCEYNLPTTGLYNDGIYCAIISCRRVLLGNKDELDSAKNVNKLVLVYFLSGALAFTTIVAVVLSYAAFTMNCQRTDFQARESPDSVPNVEGNQESDDVHYAALRKHELKRSRRHVQEASLQSYCVYSAVRQ